jgi:FkbM family methyltransferase
VNPFLALKKTRAWPAVLLLARLNNLRKAEWRVRFPLDGGVLIAMPKPRWPSFFSLSGRKQLLKGIEVQEYSSHEPLTRALVSSLFSAGYLEKELSVVDIGCWIGDSALPWAKLLDEPGLVFAIDPSGENLAWVRQVAELNGIRNLVTVEAVCAEKDGVALGTADSLDHAAFVESHDRANITLMSQTLDGVVPSDLHAAISLLHVDVEGFELRVLQGAERILSASNPVVIFEQHLRDEDPRDVVSFLSGFGYEVFMINEIIRGSRADCRNFVGFSRRRGVPEVNLFIPKGAERKIVRAIPGRSDIFDLATAGL